MKSKYRLNLRETKAEKCITTCFLGISASLLRTNIAVPYPPPPGTVNLVLYRRGGVSGGGAEMGGLERPQPLPKEANGLASDEPTPEPSRAGMGSS